MHARLVWISAAICMAGLLPLQGQNLTDEEKSFLDYAAKAGMMEVQIGRMGLKKATSGAVKKFSQRLIDEHGKANRELAELAHKKGQTLPPETPNVADTLSFASKAGTEFDREFAKAAVEDHKMKIDEFEKLAKSATDSDIKSWVNKMLPMLRNHLRAAQELPQ